MSIALSNILRYEFDELEFWAGCRTKGCITNVKSIYPADRAVQCSLLLRLINMADNN